MRLCRTRGIYLPERNARKNHANVRKRLFYAARSLDGLRQPCRLPNGRGSIHLRIATANSLDRRTCRLLFAKPFS